MMDSHLTERALEALAHDRPDLLADEERGHAQHCATCHARVAELERASEELSQAMRNDVALDLDLDRVVSAALARALQSEPAQLSAREALEPFAELDRTIAFTAPSRGSVALASSVGLAVSLAAGLASEPSWRLPTVGLLVDLLKAARTVLAALDGVVASRLPGGWGFVMLAGVLLLSLIALPLTRLVARNVRPSFSLATLTALALALSPFAGSAHALELEGELDQPVTLDVTQKPASEALRRLAASAGLGLVATLPNDPPVSLRVRDVPLRDVLSAVLGDAALLVKREGKLLVVRPLPTVSNVSGPSQGNAAARTPELPAVAAPPNAPSLPVAPALPSIPAPPPPPVAKPGAHAHAADRVIFGGSTVVQANERVNDVVTIGGHSTIRGVVEGDVVVMGGGVDVEQGAEVFGEIVAIGGSITTHPGAILHNGSAAPSSASAPSQHDPRSAASAASDTDDDAGADEDDDARHATGVVAIHDDDDEGSASDEPDGWLSSTLSSLSRHALLFVLGLVLLGAFPRRIRAVSESILESPLRAGATGVLAALAALVLCVLLVITIIGIPAGIVLALGSALAVYVGLAATAWVVGSVLPWSALRGHPIRELGVGVLLLFLTSRVPVLGAIVLVSACAVGLGAIVRTRFAEPPVAPPVVPPDLVPPSPPVDPLAGAGGAPNVGIV